MDVFDKLRFDGKRAIVTGATSGIGKATADLLMELGAEVYAVGRQRHDVDVGHHFLLANLDDPESMSRVAEEVGGPVHVLVNCAGVGSSSGQTGTNIAIQNFCGTRYMTEAVLPHLAEGSAIAMISSISGWNWRSNIDSLLPWLDTTTYEAGAEWVRRNRPDLDDTEKAGPGYRMAKEAFNLYALKNAPPFSERGIRINAIMPHGTATPMWRRGTESLDQEQFARWATGLGGKTATPIDQAWAITFLVSDAANFISGAELAVDGGWLSSNYLRLRSEGQPDGVK